MTVKELKTWLEVLDDDVTVLMSKDTEGNSLHNVHNIHPYTEENWSYDSIDTKKTIVLFPAHEID